MNKVFKCPDNDVIEVAYKVLVDYGNGFIITPVQCVLVKDGVLDAEGKFAIHPGNNARVEQGCIHCLTSFKDAQEYKDFLIRTGLSKKSQWDKLVIWKVHGVKRLATGMVMNTKKDIPSVGYQRIELLEQVNHEVQHNCGNQGQEV